MNTDLRAQMPAAVAEASRPSYGGSRDACGLVLSGGGARGAYQAGVLKGIAELLDENGLDNPFGILCGLSAGSLNAALLAAGLDDFGRATDNMVRIWSELRSQDVFRTDSVALGGNALRWIGQASLGGAFKRYGVDALLDTSPLRGLLRRELRLEDVHRHVADGRLAALAISATDYETGHGVTFVEGPPDTPVWQRFRRSSTGVELTFEHFMASSAIPFLFPPVRVGKRWYGDGGTRNSAPLSPAIHLGAHRLVVIGVRSPGVEAPLETEHEVGRPSLARVLTTMINGVLMDAIDTDVERLTRINRTLAHMSPESRAQQPLRDVECLWIHPSRDLADLAVEHVDRAPAAIRYLIAGLGPLRHTRDLYSYLLFEREYGRALVDLGRSDARRCADRLLQAFGASRAPERADGEGPRSSTPPS